MHIAHILVNFLVFAFLFTIWERKLWVNLLLKIIFFGLMIWAGFDLMVASGYVVKV